MIFDNKNKLLFSLAEKAIKNNNIEDLNLLINLGLNINHQEAHEHSLLKTSILYQSFHCFKKLIEKKANVNELDSNGLPVFVFAHDPDYLIELINAGSDLNQVFNIESFNSQNHNILTYLTIFKIKVPISTYQLILKNIKNINHISQAGSALTLSVKLFNQTLLEELLKFKVNLNQKDSKNKTSLFYAALSNNHYAVKRLLEFDIDVNLKDDNNKNVLYYSSNLEIIKALINKGADYFHKTCPDQPTFLEIFKESYPQLYPELISFIEKLNSLKSLNLI